jgi:hypothetical protein
VIKDQKKPAEKSLKNKPETQQKQDGTKAVSEGKQRIQPKATDKDTKQPIEAAQTAPLKPPRAPVGKPDRSGKVRRPGERGPDKAPRKPRQPEGSTPAPGPGPVVEPVQAGPTSAELTTQGLVVSADLLCRRFLPPGFSKDEREALIAVWTPVVSLYEDEWKASPWFPALMVSAAVLTPRLENRLRKKNGGAPATIRL